MSKKKSYGTSDSTLQKLWRQAVLKEYNHSCAFCGMGGDDNLQAHHVIFRRKRLLRNDWRNGLALCVVCHRIAHTKYGEIKANKIMEEKGYLEHLLHYENITLKDYLRQHGLSRTDYNLEVKEDLKKKINEVSEWTSESLSQLF